MWTQEPDDLGASPDPSTCYLYDLGRVTSLLGLRVVICKFGNVLTLASWNCCED